MPLPSNFRVVDCVQGTPEWFAARAGRVTSSACEVIFKEGRKAGSESVMRRDYRLQLANEQILGRSLDDSDEWKGKWVARGKMIEPEARSAYEMKTGRLVEQVGFIAGTDMMVGSSVDGHVGNFARSLELKATKTATHMRYWQSPGHAEFIKEYQYQSLMHFYCSGCEFVDLVSYCPDVPERLQLLVVEQRRPTLTTMAEFSKAVADFLTEVAREKRDVEELVARVEAEAVKGAGV